MYTHIYTCQKLFQLLKNSLKFHFLYQAVMHTLCVLALIVYIDHRSLFVRTTLTIVLVANIRYEGQFLFQDLSPCPTCIYCRLLHVNVSIVWKLSLPYYFYQLFLFLHYDITYDVILKRGTSCIMHPSTQLLQFIHFFASIVSFLFNIYIYSIDAIQIVLKQFFTIIFQITYRLICFTTIFKQQISKNTIFITIYDVNKEMKNNDFKINKKKKTIKFVHEF